MLNAYKKKLSTLTLELDRIKSDIEARHELLARIDDETNSVEEVCLFIIYLLYALYTLSQKNVPLCNCPYR